MALAPYPWLADAAKELQERRERLPNAILLSGPRGIGTFELLHRFAQSLLCEKPAPDGTPCGHCHACTMFEAHTHPDIRYIVSEAEALPRGLPFVEPDGSSGVRKAPYREILIHQTRVLADFLNLMSHEGGRRVVLVYPADKIRAEAAASLLKSLEEPPEETVFLLAADEIDEVLATIRSRCVLLRAQPPQWDEALAWLRTQNVAEPEKALREAGGMPLAVFESDPRLVMEPEERQALLTILCAGPLARNDEIIAAVARDWTLPAVSLQLVRWAWDLAAVREGGSPRYFPQCEEHLKRLAAQLPALPFYQWVASVRDIRRAQDHPLNPKVILEGALLTYARLFTGRKN